MCNLYKNFTVCMMILICMNNLNCYMYLKRICVMGHNHKYVIIGSNDL